MSLDDLLLSHHVIDCTGRITHTLTLWVDGTVQVSFAGGRDLIADPRTRSCLTPGASVPDHLWPEITALRA